MSKNFDTYRLIDKKKKIINSYLLFFTFHFHIINHEVALAKYHTSWIWRKRC